MQTLAAMLQKLPLSDEWCGLRMELYALRLNSQIWFRQGSGVARASGLSAAETEDDQPSEPLQ